MKLSDYVWDYVEKLGVRHVFMFPGGGAMHLVDSLGKNEHIDYVTLLHEQACTMAAETYSRIDYNIGVALVTTGPGGTNAITGVAAAWLESTPLLVISGQAKTGDLKDGYGVRQKGNQEIGIVDIVSSITKYAVTVKEAKKIKYYLDKAMFEAKEGRPGPVWLDIPLDIQAADIDLNDLEPFIPESGSEKNEEEIKALVKKTVTLMEQAKRPVIIAGQGIERNNGKDIFREVVDVLQIPVLFSWIAVELLEHNHKCNMGKPGMVAPRYSNFTMQEADLIIAVGTRLDPAMIGYNPKDFAPKAKKVIIDIDQYELDKFAFDIEVKIQADATCFLREFLKNIKNSIRLDTNVKKWLEQCTEWKRKYPVVKEEFQCDAGGINPYFFMDKLSDILEDNDVIIPGSSGAGIDAFWMCIKNKRNQRMLATGSLGSMGYGIPAAIGACLASGRRTICVEGDGSLQLNIQELASIKGMNLPIKIFVNNNCGYLSIMNMQRTHFDANYVGANSDSHLHIPNITEVAKAYGLHTFEIHRSDDIEKIVNAMLEMDGPALCNVIMSGNFPIQPKVMSKVTADGSMASGTLVDLWPFLDKDELQHELSL